MLGVTNVDPELLIDCESFGVRAVESHICQNQADMGHPAFVAGS
jgi:hypothetical protein